MLEGRGVESRKWSMGKKQQKTTHNLLLAFITSSIHANYFIIEVVVNYSITLTKWYDRWHRNNPVIKSCYELALNGDIKQIQQQAIQSKNRR